MISCFQALCRVRLAIIISSLLLAPVVRSFSFATNAPLGHVGATVSTSTCQPATTESEGFGATCIERQLIEVNIDDGNTHTITGGDADDLLSQCSSSVGDRIKSGGSVLQIEGIVSVDECRKLCGVCCQLDEAWSNTVIEKRRLLRLPTIAAAERAAVRNTPCADPLPADADQLLQRILMRAATLIDKQVPSIAFNLFDGEGIAQLMADNQLKYSSREPAINVYSSGGEFLPHKDSQSITVLIPLSSPDDFVGGGTSFWSQDSRGHRVEEPSVILRPPAGTAMLFGGCVTHAGVPVESGKRVVFVASFSNAKSDQPSTCTLVSQ